MANPGSFRDLTVYKKAFEFSMRIFNITKEFPSEEIYELTDQIRRSSRAICRAICEGYRKRQYKRHFASKIRDADSENTETQVSLDFAMNCNYISPQDYRNLLEKSEEIGRMLTHMIENPQNYAPKHSGALPTGNCQLQTFI